jgi:hypothetical protein
MNRTQPGTLRGSMLAALYLFSASLPSAAATLTVCASGCDHSSVQAAINAANPADVVEVKAGEVFVENIVLPYKEGSDYVTVRSSRWQELPASGFRVNPTDHAALMPHIIGLQPSETFYPAVRAGKSNWKLNRNGVNIADDTIAVGWNGYGSLDNGTALVAGAPLGYSLPDPLRQGSTYYVRDSSGYRFKLAETPGGPAVDLTSLGSSGEASEYNRPRFALERNPHHYKFIGIDFQQSAASSATYVVMIGWEEITSATAPHHIEFHHVLIRGDKDGQDGPQNCLVLNGTDLSILDSWIGHCKRRDGYESHGILTTNTPGPVLIQNNYISAASIGILSGGMEAAIRRQVATGLVIRRNHIAKQGYMLYKQGSGAPSGACYYGQGSGAFYRDTTPNPNTCANGACYVCQPDGTWAQDTGALYRNANYLTKGGIEFKDCQNCLIENNVIEAVFAGADIGNTPCVSFFQGNQGGLYHYVGDTTFRNNWCKDSWSGIWVMTDSNKFETKSHDVVIQNNLVTGMADFPRMSAHANAADVATKPVYVRWGQTGVVYDHNTFRIAPGATWQGSQALVLVAGTPGYGSMVPSFIKNNILPGGAAGSVYMDGDYTCGANGLALWFGSASSPKYLANNAIVTTGTDYLSSCGPVANYSQVSNESSIGFVSSTNHRLTSSSAYSASCQSGCRFHATDGKDLGADVDALDTSLSGVVEGAPSRSQLGSLRITSGSTAAILQYKSPGTDACTLRLYASPGRVPATEHADTSTPGWELDSRPGNTSDSLERQFILGRNAPLTPETGYYFALQCGEVLTPGEFRTRALGTEALRTRVILTDSTADHAVVEYGSDPDLTNGATTGPAGFITDGRMRPTATLQFDVPQGQVAYARWKKQDAADNLLAQGPVKAYVAP